MLCKCFVYIVCLFMFLESVQHIGQLVVFNHALEINCLALPCLTQLYISSRPDETLILGINSSNCFVTGQTDIF